MVKPSMPMMARLRLTTKHTRGGYYKGNRSGSMGNFVQPSSKYEVDWNKARTYVVPTESMETFKLTPFVTKRMEPKRSRYWKDVELHGETRSIPASLGGKEFLDLWADHNQEEVLEPQRKQQEAEENVRLAEENVKAAEEKAKVAEANVKAADQAAIAAKAARETMGTEPWRAARKEARNARSAAWKARRAALRAAQEAQEAREAAQQAREDQEAAR
ncbi:MRP-L27 domain-containing protein [Penicillium riverlandense]|uniref:MRP-L27 domain-containing protein n=1 Tax=Penicillium riverlandense TaxID=1903569 RepID=UPI002546DD3F|nr:MRP-L27 domain-containing protein [Penicillium riverlandense]KAJ5808010.1 MRP-L27 domain-containing protein [Penicillium riverlandense]